MKNSHLLASGAAFAAFLLAGCGHLDLAAPGDPNRVAVGTVTFSNPGVLPADAQIVVRIMNPHPQAPGGTNSLNQPGQMPLLNQPVTATAAVAASTEPEEVGEQTIKAGGLASPVPYKIEYQADDEVLRRGLGIEVRISYGGRVQLFNSNQYSITLPDVKDPHEVEADRMR
jgi:uncharacterized lipoprotein YbaY